MTPKSTLAAAKFLMENTRFSINNVTADYPEFAEKGRWYCKWDDINWSTFNDRYEISQYEENYTHAELEQLARSIGWKGEGE
jgi:hypothetical protein